MLRKALFLRPPFVAAAPPAGETYGPELWPQPDFDASTGLTLAGTWSISGGLASASGGDGLMTADGTPLTTGQLYRSEIEVTARSAGSVWTPYDTTGNQQTTQASSVGTHTKYFYAAATGLAMFGFGFNGSVTSASIKAVTGGVPLPQAAGTAAQGTGAVSPNWPTHEAGDIGLLVVVSAGGEAITLSDAQGFVEDGNSPSFTGTGTSGVRVAAFWCRATSGAMSAPTVADPGDHVYAQIITFRGCVASGNPINASAASQKDTASTSASAPAVTTTEDSCLIVNIIGRDNDSASAAFSNWANSTQDWVTEYVDAGTESGNGGGFGMAVGIMSTAGSTGATTATVTSSINASLTIALRGL